MHHRQIYNPNTPRKKTKYKNKYNIIITNHGYIYIKQGSKSFGLRDLNSASNSLLL